MTITATPAQRQAGALLRRLHRADLALVETGWPVPPSAPIAAEALRQLDP